MRFVSRKMVLSVSSLSAALAISMGGCPLAGTGDAIDPGDPGASTGSGAPQPPLPPQNAPPSVSAGADQTLAGGAAVALTATASDPEGGPLSYLWTQTSGTPVALSGANTAAASFTAPFVSGALAFSVAVTDAQGATAADGVVVTVDVQPVLFIANFTGGITSYANPSAVNGNIAPSANLAGPATQLAAPADIVVDAAGSLIVGNFVANRLTAYADAAHANGNMAPARNVSGLATQLAGPASLAIDAAADLLFVANYGGAPDNIAVYADASTAALNGNLAPTRQFTNAAINNPSGINLDSAGSLYIANSGAGNVLVYANAGNLNGSVAPTRTISSPLFAGCLIFDVFVDADDRLFVLSALGPQRIFVFERASSLNGAVMPDVVLDVAGAVALRSIVVDAAGTGYITDAAAGTGAVYAYDNIATRNGALPPDRTISGANTQMSGPIRLFLLER
jgi:hypothetical protein